MDATGTGYMAAIPKLLPNTCIIAHILSNITDNILHKNSTTFFLDLVFCVDKCTIS